MARIIVILIIVFTIPFLVYRAAQRIFGWDRNGVNWLNAPLGTLAFFGALLSIATVIALTLWSEGTLKLDWLGL